MKTSERRTEIKGGFCVRVARRLSFAFRALVVASSAVLAAACMKPEGRGNRDLGAFSRRDGSNATWIVDSISGTQQISATHRIFRTPEAKQYDITVCIRDRRTQEAVRGHEFTLKSPGQDEPRTLRTDARGCLNWGEDVRYNFLADPIFVPLEFEARGTGAHSGSRVLQVAVNPWAHGGEEFIDLERRSIPQVRLGRKEESAVRLAGRLLGSASESGARNTGTVRRPIAVDELNFEHNRDLGDGSRMILTFVPRVWLTDVEGRAYEHVFVAGRFKVSARVISSVESPGGARNRTVIATAESGSVPLEIRDGVVRFSFDPKLEVLPMRGQVEIALGVEPVDGPAGLGPFTGLFLLGDADALNGSRSATLRILRDGQTPQGARLSETLSQASDFSRGRSGGAPGSAARTGATGSGLSESGGLPAITGQNNAPGSVRPSHLVRLGSFELTPLQARAEQVHNLSATYRALDINIRTCALDPRQRDRLLRDAEFTVFIDGSTQGAKLTSDRDGCLNIEDRIEHFYYVPEQLMIRRYRVRSAQGFEVTRELVVNPWDDGFPGFFARDLNVFGGMQKVAQINSQRREHSRMIVPAYSYERARTRYSIDSSLTLHLHRAFLLNLAPRVIRHSIRRGTNEPEPLRPGLYLLKAALQRDHREAGIHPVEYVSALKKIVNVADGRIQTPVEFTFRDMRYLTMVTQLVVELSPLKHEAVETVRRLPPGSTVDLEQFVAPESEGLKSRTFIGPVIPGDRQAAATLRPTDDLSEAYCRTIDCDMLKAGDIQASAEVDPNEARFFGAIAHLRDVTVTQLIARKLEHDAAYRARMQRHLRIADFARDQNLEVVTLKGAEALLAAEPELERHNRVLPFARATAELVSRTAGPAPAGGRLEPVTEQTLERVVGGGEFTNPELARICLWWFGDFMRKSSSAGEAALPTSVLRTAVDACRNNLFATRRHWRTLPIIGGFFDSPLPFAIEHKLRVFKVDDWEVREGRGMDFNVAASFSVDASESVSWSESRGVSPLAVTEFLPISAVFKSLASMFDWSFSRTRSSGQSQHQGRSFNTGVNLTMERAEARLLIAEYERCVTLRLHPEFLRASNLARNFGPMLNPEERAQTLTRGLLICKGERSNERIIAPENYYYFSSLLTSDQLLERNDPNNQSWMIGLRGDFEYMRFVSSLEARPKDVTSIPREQSIGSAPLNQLQDALSLARHADHFRHAQPTYPGFLTITNPARVVPAGRTLRDAQRPRPPTAPGN